MSKICFITGSTQGIGLAIAQRLAQLGHQVILNGRQAPSSELLASFAGAPHPPQVILGDVSDFDQARAMIQEVKGRFQRIDVLINNAGITDDQLLMRMSEASFDRVLDINLKGTFNMCRFAVPLMIRQRSGQIINMSSVVGILGNAGQVNYAASKAGVLGLTKSLARELAPRQILVNAIAPGFIQTAMTDALSDKQEAAILKEIPLGRLGQVEDIAQVVEFLLEQNYLTGQTIEVNGGMHMSP